jgi:hypothetical protein
MSKGTDWISIEGHFRSGLRALRDIAAEFGITEGAIRARAKKQGWTRDAAGTKRKMVADRMAGVTQDVTQDVMRNIECAAEQDTKDMSLALRGARAGLASAVAGLESGEADAKDTKVWSETIKLNVETIRKIRGLDESEKTALPEPLVINLPAAQ